MNNTYLDKKIKAEAILELWERNKNNPEWNQIAEITAEALKGYIQGIEDFLEFDAHNTIQSEKL